MTAGPSSRATSAEVPRFPSAGLEDGLPRTYGRRPHLSPEAAATFATLVDTARAKAAVEGRTLVYTIRWA